MSISKQRITSAGEIGARRTGSLQGQSDSSKGGQSTHTGGDSWWARQIRDKLMPSAFCLLHALLQHNEPATHALIRRSRWQAYYTTRSPGVGRVEGVPGMEGLYVTRAKHL